MSRQSTPGKSRAAAHHQHSQRHQRECRQPEAHASTHRWVFGLLPGPAQRGNVGLAASAAFAALLFAIHPLRVESVAWATERRDVLSGLFYLLTLLVYLRAGEQGERGRSGYWASVGLFVCALLSK